MLTLTRPDQTITMFPSGRTPIVIKTRVAGNTVKVSIQADNNTKILRTELIDEKARQVFGS